MLEAKREVAQPGFASDVSLVKSKFHRLFPLHKAVAPESFRATPKGPPPWAHPAHPCTQLSHTPSAWRDHSPQITSWLPHTFFSSLFSATCPQGHLHLK